MYNYEKYKKMLFSPEISYDEITSSIKPPPKLYKFQSFYKQDGKENPYWRKNMQGEFHTSLGKEFEDENDCKPYFDRIEIFKIIENFLAYNHLKQEEIEEMRKILEPLITEEQLNKKIANNYQSQIRIGCFTDSSDNLEMWNKYSDMGKGYCIEYNTNQNELFQKSTLPVLYGVVYNSSLTFASLLILDIMENAKKRTSEENLSIYEDIYKKVIKTTYIPIFIKNSKWSFEREYRMFILEHRTITTSGRSKLLKKEDLPDKNANLDLSEDIKTIYLGENFEKNKNYKELLENVFLITENKKIPLFIKKKKYNGRYKNIKVDKTNINDI